MTTSEIPSYQLYINGQWQAGSDGVFERLSPAHEQPVARFEQASRSQAEQAVAAARSAFDSGVWSESDAADRAEVLFKFADLLMEHQERLGALESITHGTPIKYGRSFIQSAATTFRYFAGLARDLSGHAHHFGDSRMGLTLREPVGVASLILPWNFPIGELAWKLGPALAAGCTVVVKPDSKTAATALEAGPLLKEAGLPDGVFNVVVGEVSEIGDVLTGDPGIDAVSFTGSSNSGRLVMKSASERVKPLHLELGGKSPLIIMDDADIDKAASDAAFGIFWHNGQVCTACSRLLVHENVYDSFVEKMIAVARTMKLGDPDSEETELGPMIGPEHLARVLQYIQIGSDEGAELLLDGREGMPEKGAYLGPTVFADVKPSMTIAREEIFGPVACVMKISSLEEAIELANDTEYGLGAGIWTENINGALKAARRIRSGSFWVNGYGSERLEMPWGGYKQSGFGRELGRDAFEVFMQTKSVHISHS
ncbi:aldehyde dehydrogenase [Pseudomaricurvus alkylphenolicus]|uniref:aldehyde dehydrogenase family protein n=1 Tax=Pseudomaricurvus alkylphenolicus TaxID=1306991 RepID=UPI001422F896|nr:aldehyde dehydrogenase family protein [Pseudomaricurvus alkylphenolicus]NIB45150.1 aldehyde dehydrogenase [Pseudomaricurvus alkylphenolicus]